MAKFFVFIVLQVYQQHFLFLLNRSELGIGIRLRQVLGLGIVLGLVIDNIFVNELAKSTFASNSLARTGFIINSEKSVWQPTQEKFTGKQKSDYLETKNLASNITMTWSKKFCTGSLTYVTLTIKCSGNTEFHLYLFPCMHIITDYLLFTRTRVRLFICYEILI